jgi:hypothetical protein
MIANDGQSNTTMPVARRTVRRLPLVLALVAVLVAAVVAGNGHGNALRAVPVVTPTEAAAMPAANARSAAWYCPGLPPSRLLANAPDRVAVANLETRPVDVAVTVVPDRGNVLRRSIRAPARGTVTAASGAAAKGAVIVEPFAASVAAQSSSSAPGVAATAACATQPSTSWHFAQGTTVRGTEDWIVLFNPFGDDAIVDMSFFTDNGFAEPVALQGKTVPRRSRVVIPVHNYVHYQRIVATTITARSGRIVAQQTVIYAHAGQPAGVTRTLGAVTTARQWVFPSATSAAGDVRTIGISDPGDADGQVYVQVTTVNKAVVEPVTVSVPRNGVTTVQIGTCAKALRVNCIALRPGVQYSVLVHATRDVGVVAQDLSTWSDDTRGGANALVGNTAGARQWVFPAALGTTGNAVLDLLNAQGAVSRVSVAYVANGRRVTPRGMAGIVLRPNEQRDVALSGRPEWANGTATIVVTATEPVVAQRTLFRADDVSVDLGIPARG